MSSLAQEYMDFPFLPPEGISPVEFFRRFLFDRVPWETGECEANGIPIFTENTARMIRTWLNIYNFQVSSYNRLRVSYHYTSKEGAKGIPENGLKKSTSPRVQVTQHIQSRNWGNLALVANIPGDMIYLTPLPPEQVSAYKKSPRNHLREALRLLANTTPFRFIRPPTNIGVDLEKTEYYFMVLHLPEAVSKTFQTYLFGSPEVVIKREEALEVGQQHKCVGQHHEYIVLGPFRSDSFRPNNGG